MAHYVNRSEGQLWNQNPLHWGPAAVWRWHPGQRYHNQPAAHSASLSAGVPHGGILQFTLHPKGKCCVALFTHDTDLWSSTHTILWKPQQLTGLYVSIDQNTSNGISCVILVMVKLFPSFLLFYRKHTLTMAPEPRFSENSVPFVNHLNAELIPICYLLALLRAHHFLHVSRIRVKSLILRLLMSYIYIYIYIYGAPILDVSRSHTTTHHSR